MRPRVLLLGITLGHSSAIATIRVAWVTLLPFYAEVNVFIGGVRHGRRAEGNIRDICILVFRGVQALLVRFNGRNWMGSIAVPMVGILTLWFLIGHILATTLSERKE